jgi:UrcA family protein
MQSLVLRTGDLDLNRPKDMARLYQRIVSAADRLCGPRSVGGMPGKSIDYVNCYDTAVNRAVENIGRPSVTAYFQQRNTDSTSRSLTALQ